MKTNELLEFAIKNNNFLMTLGAVMVGADVNCRVTYQEYVSDSDYYTGCDTSYYKTKETTLLFYAKTKAMKALLKRLGCLSAEEMAGKWVKESKEELSWGGKLLLGAKLTFVTILGILKDSAKLLFKCLKKHFKNLNKHWYKALMIALIILLYVMAVWGELVVIGGPTPYELFIEHEGNLLSCYPFNYSLSKTLIGLVVVFIGFRGAWFIRHNLL